MIGANYGDFTFRCIACDGEIEIDPANPPSDADMIRCGGCGRSIGEYAAVKIALIEEAKAQIEAQLRLRLGETTS